ncbi:MAG: extensin family protein [Zhengella sp.]|uniref:extensin-like domain-containing protein n=1 Tax=Zhengella sp. TaxID=2282762 RepID=UPI001DC50D23|nr:extensin family protein [Notoacmeibacter sp.]MCC0027475.1 extensin family protein [Brucellaceae bacterium]
MANDKRRNGRRHALRGFALATMALALTACFGDDDVLRPMVGVDRQARTASLYGGMMSPDMFAEPETMPASEEACRRRLRRMDVTFRDLPRISEGGGCGIAWPVEVTGLPHGVKLKPAATVTCAMAEAVAKWTDEELVPAARLRYLSGVDTIRQGSSYSCRRIRGSGTLSAHGTGNALDIMDITLNSGRNVDVRRPGFFSFREKSLLASVREDACPYFSTVLGPGYDRDHRDHFHFDLMQRSSKRRVCK